MIDYNIMTASPHLPSRQGATDKSNRFVELFYVQSEYFPMTISSEQHVYVPCFMFFMNFAPFGFIICANNNILNREWDILIFDMQRQTVK